MTVLAVRVLGEPELVLAHGPVPFPAGRPGRLLAALVLAHGRALAVERLVDDVWGEEPPGEARAALHTTVARARRALAEQAALVQRTSAGYRLDDADVRLDSDDFLARIAPVPGEDATARVQRYDAALALWRGPAWGVLAEDLAAGEALRLTEARLGALEERAAALLETDHADRAVGELRLLVADEPLRERAVGLLMTALRRTGDVAGALAAYAVHRRRLADELGLDPSPELVDLHRELLLRRPAPGRRLSVVRPEEPGGAAGPRLHGRDAQLATLDRMLGLHRCVTVVGPGGVGKTTLAAHAVSEREHWWVDLATVSDPSGVLPAVAGALGVEAFPGATLAEAVRHRAVSADRILVLDNCEHLLGVVGELAEDLLAAGPRLRVLATSRERLAAVGEQVLLLPPLQLPAAGSEAAESPAVALFLERAAAVAPDLPTDEATLRAVADLVRRLDGLPLAIELAAGRVGAFTLDDLHARLSDRLDLLHSTRRRGPRRQRTLSATIAWSVDLLAPAERSVFLRLSVFAGSFDLDAAEAVLGPGAADLVGVLAERSLLVRPGPRGRGEYRMLETLRAFARARLDEIELAAVRRAHASWAADLVERAATGLLGPEEAGWGARLDAAQADVAAAVRWAIAGGEAALAARLVGGLDRWAYYRLRPDVLRWALDVLDLGDAGETATVQVCAASYHWLTGSYDAARAHGERAVALAEPGSVVAARALDALSDVALAVGDLDESMRCSRAGYEAANAAGAWSYAATAAVGMVLAETYAGGDATHLLAVAHRAAIRSGNPTWSAFVRYAEAEVLADSDPQHALAASADAIRIATPVDNRLVLGIATTVDTAIRCRSGPLTADTVEHTCRAIRHWIASGNAALFLTCLRNVAPLLERLGAAHALVELVAATSGTDAAYGAEAIRIDAGLRHARAVLGEEGYSAAWATGAGRSPVEAGQELLELLPGLVGT
ncbi:MAG TPA: BTAD domain-containing putative transcriptional regulator [Nocardioides sp.]|uniref:BTAD domain-containing putative transcriptional regulator n=1 Tax=Nocardioides sp. TaxID=35761 RepID=UPI002C4F8238|nr:BTAD domain-containing putative transcriptional regulator [Nocardioides sp.]HTW16262.1 BTAD domain-containing putative transcriptional regulator [Nocardioides sp.]